MMHNLRKHSRHMTMALLLSIPFTAGAAQSSAPDTWAGFVASPALPSTHVDATFDGRQVSLHFDEPANCRIVAALLHADEDGSYYRLRPSQNGGAFCARMYPGEVAFTRSDADRTTMTFHRGGAVWSGTLQPVESP